MLQLTAMCHCKFSLKYLQLEHIHAAMTCNATDWHALIGKKINDVKTCFHGLLYLQLPSILAATTCNATDCCWKISDSVRYLRLTATDWHTHCNWLRRDVTLQSVATCMLGLKPFLSLKCQWILNRQKWFADFLWTSPSHCVLLETWGTFWRPYLRTCSYFSQPVMHFWRYSRWATLI